MTDRGILRSIVAGAIYTQQVLFISKKSDDPVCVHCWQQQEDLLHLFWHCPAWNHIRSAYLSAEQLRFAQTLPPCTLRTGLFVNTPAQAYGIVQNHQALCSDQQAVPLPPHPCTFPDKVQHMMVEIIKARKVAEPLEPPDDFDPSQFARKPTSAQPDSSLPSSSTSKQPSDFKFHKVAPDHSKPKTDENGLLLPASLRPGGSRFQYVQKKKDTYRAIIPLGAKRHSIGPFSSEEDAARAVKDFLERWDAGVAPTTRGSKQEDKHTKNIQLQLDQLNIHAKKEGRHCILDAAAPTCAFCNQSVQRYYILQFAKKQCHAISNKVDSRGSATKAEKLSQTRSAQLQSDVDEHNKQAVTRGRHYIVDIFQPSCFYCKQKVSKNYLRTWMKKDCKFKHD